MRALLELAITLQQSTLAEPDHQRSFSAMPAGHHMLERSGAYETVIVAVGIAITVLVLVMTVRYFVRPGEAGANHVKRRVLRDDMRRPL